MVLPWLQDKIRNSWVDPRQFKTDADLGYAYRTSWAWAQAAEGILRWMESRVEEAEALTKKEQGEIKNMLKETFK